MATKFVAAFVVFNFFLAYFTDAVPERGVKDMIFNKANQYHSFSKSLFKDAKIYINGDSNTTNPNTTKLKWFLYKSNCAQAFVGIEDKNLALLIAQRKDTNQEFVRFYNEGYEDKLDGVFKIEITLKNPQIIRKLPVSTKKSGGKSKIMEKLKNPKSGGKSKTKGNLKNPKSGEKSQTTGKLSGEISQTTGKLKTKVAKPKLPISTKLHVSGQQLRRKKKTTENSPQRSRRNIRTRIIKRKQKRDIEPSDEKQKQPTLADAEHKQPTTQQPSRSGDDGNYLLVIKISRNDGQDFNVKVQAKIKSSTGYLSAAEWPLLPYYGAMSLLYLTYGVVWLIVSACQWRELLRIQFWIGGVIALGMLEKAVLFSEYSNVNNTGIPANGLVVFAQVLSCIKRTLSRILIIIVSMGFGIVKPRLGGALHRVLGVAFLYFILCVIEGSYREKSAQADVGNKGQLFAAVPLSVLDAVICWWIFMSLMQTMRTLRIRKNIVKLSLYRHFTNILVVAVIASVAFMIWVIKYHHFSVCIQDWKELWIDDAFWHFLFALVLLAIMILWRPTVNNQRYAFTPLIDVGDDDNDDMTLSDAFQGMKMRSKMDADSSSHAERNSRTKLEDDLKWVEEHIPTAGGIDTALPTLLDSDEEVMTTKLEMSKME